MPRYRFHDAPVGLGASPAQDDAEYDRSGRLRLVRLNQFHRTFDWSNRAPVAHSPVTAETPTLRAINERNRRHYGGDDAA